MRWLLEGLKAVVSLLKDTMIAGPRLVRGGGGVIFLFAVAMAGLMAINPDKYWWAPHALIGAGALILVVLMIGVVALGSEMAGGSGGMGGRTGVLLADLDAPPPEDPHRKPAPVVRREGVSLPEWKVKPKADAARVLLDFLAGADRAFDRKRIIRWIEDTAVRVRGAVEDQNLRAVANRLTPHGRQELQANIDALAADRGRRVFGKVKPLDVQPVLVDAPSDPTRHAVTALVTLKSRGYTVDSRTGDVRDGDKAEWVISEDFWSFRRDGTTWRLDRVGPADEADELLDVLNELAADRYREFQRIAPATVLEQVTPVEH